MDEDAGRGLLPGSDLRSITQWGVGGEAIRGGWGAIVLRAGKREEAGGSRGGTRIDEEERRISRRHVGGLRTEERAARELRDGAIRVIVRLAAASLSGRSRLVVEAEE